jgi:hypothetical protein
MTSEIVFVFEAQLPPDVKVRSVHSTAKEAAVQAWKFSKEHKLGTPLTYWYTDKEFVSYMTETAQERTVVLAGGAGQEMRIYTTTEETNDVHDAVVDNNDDRAEEKKPASRVVRAC